MNLQQSGFAILTETKDLTKHFNRKFSYFVIPRASKCGALRNDRSAWVAR
jgi:hypothetical protein